MSAKKFLSTFFSKKTPTNHLTIWNQQNYDSNQLSTSPVSSKTQNQWEEDQWLVNRTYYSMAENRYTPNLVVNQLGEPSLSLNDAKSDLFDSNPRAIQSNLTEGSGSQLDSESEKRYFTRAEIREIVQEELALLRIYVLESDITAAQNAVRTIVEEATF